MKFYWFVVQRQYLRGIDEMGCVLLSRGCNAGEVFFRLLAREENRKGKNVERKKRKEKNERERERASVHTLIVLRHPYYFIYWFIPRTTKNGIEHEKIKVWNSSNFTWCYKTNRCSFLVHGWMCLCTPPPTSNAPGTESTKRSLILQLKLFFNTRWWWK